ncbi:MAG: M23 family metallopeptidase [Actinomycetota bacterium]
MASLIAAACSSFGGGTQREPKAQLPTPAGTASPAKTPSPATAGLTHFQYEFPVQLPSVTSYVQGHHDYPATDIFAPEGSPFVAVTSGVVEEVGRTDVWDPALDDPETRGGLSVSIIGDDGVRYYGSHLMSVRIGIRVDFRVEAGELLGRVGLTGNARGTDPHLHFGISPATRAGDWRIRRGMLDPFPYLQAWRQGRDLSPRRAARVSR